MRRDQNVQMIAATILAIVLGLVAGQLPTVAVPAAVVSGFVFFDRNGDGVRGSEEPGLAGVTVTLSGAGFAQTVNSAGDGSYAFTGITSGSYTITEQNPAGFVSTTLDSVALIVGAGDMIVDFGDVLPHTVSGTVFDDFDLDGVQALTEPGIEGATIEVYDDADGDGAVGIAEALLGADVSDEQGNYLIPNLLPGQRVLFIEIPADYHPAGNSGGEVRLDLISSEVGGNLTVVNVPLRKADPAAATLIGQVWHDKDGDGDIDAGESALSGVVIAIIGDTNGNGHADADETVVASAISGAAGTYRLFDLAPGVYVAAVDASTLPFGWLLSPSLAAQALILTAGNNNLSLGYFDLLGVSPLRESVWRQESLHADAGRYDPAEFAAIVQAAAARTQLFPALGALPTVFAGPAASVEAKARRQYAALLLNVASGRLFAETPIGLPALSAAVTIDAALADIEAVLWPPFGFAASAEYVRVLKLAGTLNDGQGIGMCQPAAGNGSLFDAAQICR